MLNRWKKEKDLASETATESRDRKNVWRLLTLIAVTLAVLVVYRFFLNHRWFLGVMIAYMAIFTVLVFTYVIYNRGFSRRNVTVEMLPDSWSEEQKREFIESGSRRLARSRWMLIPIFAFGFTFAFDAMELFVFPYFKQMFLK